MDGLKEFFTYITNQLKFWFIVKEWENGLQLRNGRILRELSYGLYFKIPFLDFIYCQPKRTKDIVISQVNFTTKDGQQITASATAFFKVVNIREYYNGYAEPLSILDGIIKNEINKYFLETDYKGFKLNEIESRVLDHLRKIEGKGMMFEDFKIITFSNAKTYRLITDKLYSQVNSELDSQVY